MKFEEGTEVLARYSSTDEFLKGKILSVRGDSYRIKFETGSERTIHSNDVKVCFGIINLYFSLVPCFVTSIDLLL